MFIADSLSAELNGRSRLCCHQGVSFFKAFPQNPSYDFGIVYSTKGRQCRGRAQNVFVKLFLTAQYAGQEAKACSLLLLHLHH